MSTQNALPPRRRRRTQLACNPCRARKTGCDGRRPVCTSCSMKALGDQCAYQERASSSKTPTLSDVNSRLQSLEVKVRGDPHLRRIIAGTSLASGTAIPVPSEQGVMHQSHDAEEDIVYGPSSNISFLQEVIQLQDPEMDTAQPSQSTTCPKERTIPDLLGFTVVQSPSLAHSVDPVSLPERQFADALFRCFWDFIHPVFPILHRPSYATMYDHLWQQVMPSAYHYKQTNDDVVFHATLNMVLALGCQRSEQIPSAQRNQFADSFYRRSHRLISIETLDFSSLQIVQLLLLRAIYLHYTTYADRCWNMVGVALRVAQGLGLHLEQTAPSKNQLKREMRRRVWHNCVALDRLSATTFGRPVLHCRPHAIPLPEPIDDEYLSEFDEGCQPENSPSRIAFFIYSMKLFDVLDEILHKFYSHRYQNLAQDGTVTSSQYLSDVPRLCSELDQFVEGLPGHLKADRDMGAVEDESASCFHMQAMILKSRVLYVRLLLLRPSLLIETRRSVSNQPSINNNTTRSLQRSYLREINRLCVSTCHEVLEEVHRNLGSLRQTSAWHTLLFTFGAASTLLAASLCPDLEVNLDLDPAKTSWERALQIFEFHKSHVESAAKGIEALGRYRLRFSTFAKKDQSVASNDGQIADPIPFDAASAVDESWLTGMAEDFNEFFTSDSLEQSWLSSQGIDWIMQ
ncbi:fungal-specific transcription factor domain-containing protein [Fusarium oxysporum f. sp. albedinis]|nr:fungal-specific transcription factor domain-containing protein [Fusarium oxysporum f. sp. albedinis]KAK2469923.1 hypothetical protein H9L39_18738 [Fusarium oxysporum f. sp. albedinis]